MKTKRDVYDLAETAVYIAMLAGWLLAIVSHLK